MFRSYTCEFDTYRASPRYLRIVDDDFTVDIAIFDYRYLFDIVIEEYEKRGLSVASNLFLAMQFEAKRHIATIKGMLPLWCWHNKLLSKYTQDLDKYLLLL